MIAGSVRELPVTSAARADILARLVEIQTILQNGTLTLTTIERLLAVLQLLQVVVLKVANRKVPCTQGLAEIRLDLQMFLTQPVPVSEASCLIT